MTSQRTQGQIEDNIFSSKPIKIAIVGDIHDRWEAADETALQHLGVDLVLFVGDFGNESVQVVREIAAVKLPKATVFGNHDAWYSASDWGKQKCPDDPCGKDWQPLGGDYGDPDLQEAIAQTRKMGKTRNSKSFFVKLSISPNFSTPTKRTATNYSEF